MHRTVRLACIGFALGVLPFPTAGRQQTGVTETLIGPSLKVGQYSVSPDGGHLAASGAHGSREVVFLDGVAGPDFDQAATFAGGLDRDDIAWSPDGTHSAYTGRLGAQLVAVVDGKVAFTIMENSQTGATMGIDPYNNGMGNRSRSFLFSPSGAHYVVVATESGGVTHAFLDGVKGPLLGQIDPGQFGFAADKLIYAGQTPDTKWHVFTNTTPGPGYDQVTGLVFSSNRQHYAYIGRSGANSVVVTDGIAGTPKPNVVTSSGLHNLVIASNGRVGYQGYSGKGPYTEQLYIGDQLVAPETVAFAGPPARNGIAPVIYLVFSPDGSKYAYVKPVPGGVAAVIDGKTSISYDAVGQMAFGPDNKRAFFVGMKKPVGNFVVVDGQEMDMQNTVRNFVWSADGSRFGYEAYLASSGFSFVVDGKSSPRYVNLIGNSLAFSADGKHGVWAGCTNYSKCELVVDGTATPLPSVGDFTSRQRPQVLPPPVMYGPDGRLAYVYPKSDGTNTHVVMLGGQEIARGTTLEFPMFSPDGKHFALINWAGKGYQVMVDGKPGPIYEEIFEANPNVVRFLDAHTLRLLAVKGGQVYRVTIPVP